jgi:cysteine desulfurase
VSPLPYDEREARRVPGFENVPAIVAAAVALGAASTESADEDRRRSGLIDRIRARVAASVPDVEVVGDPVDRLPHILTFSCLYVDGEALLAELDKAGFAVSSGSSCTSSTLTPSHVLEAMGVLSQGNIRVSLPRGVAEAEVDRFLAILPPLVAELRAVTAPAPARGAAVVAVAEGVVVDALGKRCPIPVIELAKRILDVEVGAGVTVLSDDEASSLDIPAWCEMTGHEFVAEEVRDRGRAFTVRRRH